jgi:pyrroline-5-carboxylate reductase
MKTKSLGFIGGGRITKIFLQAFAKKNAKHGSIIVYDTNNEVLSSRKRESPSIETADSAVVAAKQDIVFIALHPPMIMETLDKISGHVNKSTLVVSLAPKISLDKFESKLKTKNIVRMIPNATSYINEGFNPVTFNPGFADDEKPALMELLSLLGKTFEVTEPKLEAYAILSAMLPTYFWFQWEELGKLGAQLGLTEKETRKAIMATLKKSIKLYYKSGLTPEEVIDLIPVKPIGEYQEQITEIYRIKLLGLYEKIKP